MDWKAETMLGDMALRVPLLIEVSGTWAPTTPYELLNAYRFPRFLTIDQIEFTMGTEIRMAVVSGREGSIRGEEGAPAMRRRREECCGAPF